MIKYTLKCPEGHRFDSWFASAEAYDSLAASGHVSCAICGAGAVEKAVMAPRVRSSERDAQTPAVLAAPATEMERKLAELRKHVEENSDYVGPSFAQEARAIHEGASPSRSIHGEASGREVKSLLEDGVPVAPLPFTPARKVN